jgi:hypothetical protein
VRCDAKRLHTEIKASRVEVERCLAEAKISRSEEFHAKAMTNLEHTSVESRGASEKSRSSDTLLRDHE